MIDDSQVPDFFERFPMQAVGGPELAHILAEPGEAKVTVLFLWGYQCPNCDIAKRALLTATERFRWPDVRWLHANVYAEPALAPRFGLQGVPTFLVYKGTERAGRITGWPGSAPFLDAIEAQRAG